MDLRRQIAIVRAWLPLLIACVAVSAGTALAVSNLVQKSYEAKATLIVGQSLSAVNPDYTQLLASQNLTTTYASVATTRPILESVIHQLGLTGSVDALAGRVRADASQSSTLLTIAAQDPDPARAAAIANAIANQLIAESPTIQGHSTALQQSVDANLKATQAQIDASEAEAETLSGIATRTPAEDARLQTLESQLVSLMSTYANLLSFSSGSASNLLTVVEPAVAPASPVSPRPLLNTLLAALVGLFIAGAIIVVMEYLDDTVKTPEDIQEVAGLSTLGTIVRMRVDKGRSETYRLATLLYPRSVAAEAYRTLRTNIEFASIDAPVTTLLITSALPGEGKTVTAANLAVAFAQAGQRVVLVDADFRKPGVHLIFDLPNAEGLSTFFRREGVSLEAVAYVSEQDNLRIVTAGPLPPNPAEALSSQRMRAILGQLTVGADLVIFDSPPLEVVTDAAVLSSFVDGTLLVVEAGRSRRTVVRSAREALTRAGAHVYGAVLNRVPQRASSDAAEYYGDSYHSAGEAPALSAASDKPPRRPAPRSRARAESQDG